MTKRVKVFSIVSLALLAVFIGYYLIVNSQINSVLNERDTSLDFYEATKLWVLEDVRDYLMVTDAESYASARGSTHLSTELKADLYGSSYESRSFVGATSVSFVDAQYTLEGEDVLVYLLANVKTNEGFKELSFVVFIKNNLIDDLIAF